MPCSIGRRVQWRFIAGCKIKTLIDILRAAISSGMIDMIWDRLIEGKKPEDITLDDFLDHAAMNRLRRAIAMERAKRGKV